MGDIKVELNAEDINKAIADAIVRSVLGDAIVKMVNEYVKSISSSYDNPVKKIVESVGKDLIINIIEGRRKEFEIEINKQLTEEMARNLVTKAIESMMSRY